MPGRFSGSLPTITGAAHTAPRVELRQPNSPTLAPVYADGDGEYALANPLPSASTGAPGVDRSGSVIFFADAAVDLFVIDGSRTFGPYTVTPTAGAEGPGGVIDGGTP